MVDAENDEAAASAGILFERIAPEVYRACEQGSVTGGVTKGGIASKRFLHIFAEFCANMCFFAAHFPKDPAVLKYYGVVTYCYRSNSVIDLLMGLFRGAVFRHGGGALKQPIKEPTETPTSTLALMGRFPSLMGRFPALMGRFTDFILRGRFMFWKSTGKQPIKKRGIKRLLIHYLWRFPVNCLQKNKVCQTPCRPP